MKRSRSIKQPSCLSSRALSLCAILSMLTFEVLSLIFGLRVVSYYHYWTLYVAGGFTLLDSAICATLLVAVSRQKLRLILLMLDILTVSYCSYLTFMVTFGLIHSITEPQTHGRLWLQILIVGCVDALLWLPISLHARDLSLLQEYSLDIFDNVGSIESGESDS